MNYWGRINHKSANDFVREFEEEHQGNGDCFMFILCHIQDELFEAAAVAHPEMHSPTPRAMYGVDVILDSSFQLKLLEMTYGPDCKRACKYDMDIGVGEGGIVKGSISINHFFNVFRWLSLNEISQLELLSGRIQRSPMEGFGEAHAAENVKSLDETEFVKVLQKKFARRGEGYDSVLGGVQETPAELNLRHNVSLDKVPKAFFFPSIFYLQFSGE
ncbi:Gamma carbonic anhydrase 1 [Spatholobus suberectus]|nr:Gamma carbonic anhydrase 1 [Spatholobus suberectus]